LFLLFWALSGISPANRSRSGPKSVHIPRSRADNVHKIWGTMIRSAKWGQNGGLKSVPDACLFFCRQYQTTFRQLCNGRFSPNSATTRESWVKCRIRTEIYEKSIPGSFAPKTRNFEGVKQVPHSEQATSQGIHGREILFIPCCSPRAREFPLLVNFSVGRTVAELRGFKVAQFSDFGLFSPYKTRKTYLPVKSLQPRGYITE